jgi:hypothetical protein
MTELSEWRRGNGAASWSVGQNVSARSRAAERLSVCNFDKASRNGGSSLPAEVSVLPQFGRISIKVGLGQASVLRKASACLHEPQEGRREVSVAQRPSLDRLQYFRASFLPTTAVQAP